MLPFCGQTNCFKMIEVNPSIMHDYAIYRGAWSRFDFDSCSKTVYVLALNLVCASARAASEVRLLTFLLGASAGSNCPEEMRRGADSAGGPGEKQPLPLPAG